MSDEQWFRMQPARCSTGVVVLPMTYVGDQSLVGAEAWVRGEHVIEAVGQGNVLTEELATLGNLRPGDRCLIMVSLDGEPGPQTIQLHVKAAGCLERFLTVEVPADGRAPMVTERPGGLTVDS